MAKAKDSCILPDDVFNTIESIYQSKFTIVSVLSSAGKMFVPSRRKGFFKFWWDDNIRALKQASIDSNRAWKAAGRPRQGSIFSERQSCRKLYRKSLEEYQNSSGKTYTNDLHEALLKKDATAFWRCWRSKFNCKDTHEQVNSSVDPDIIVNSFADHFRSSFCCN